MKFGVEQAKGLVKGICYTPDPQLYTKPTQPLMRLTCHHPAPAFGASGLQASAHAQTLF